MVKETVLNSISKSFLNKVQLKVKTMCKHKLWNEFNKVFPGQKDNTVTHRRVSGGICVKTEQSYKLGLWSQKGGSVQMPLSQREQWATTM